MITEFSFKPIQENLCYASTEALFPPPAPFLKWAGGKRQLLSVLLQRIPSLTDCRYHEPFLGGGALFFALQTRGLLGKKSARLADINEELINTYKVVQKQVEPLIRLLSCYKNDSDLFYSMRAVQPHTLDPIERAARMIYLNKTCFNGLFRENQQGQFNVPFGHYTSPKICDEVGLRSASMALKKASIEHTSFEELLSNVKKGDFVYLDPPYVPLNKTSSFVGYTAKGFQKEAHFQVANLVQQLEELEVNVLASNSGAQLVYELYAKFPKEEVLARRAINSKASHRGRVGELLIYAGPFSKNLWHLRDSNPEPYAYEASALTS